MNSYMPRALHDGPHKQVIDVTVIVVVVAKVYDV